MKRAMFGSVVSLMVCVALAVPNFSQAANNKASAKAAERKASLEAREKARAEKAAELEKKRAENAGEQKKERGNKHDFGGKSVDARENNQARRIQHGINKGYLTADEVTTLQAQQQSIANLEGTLKADGKLSKSDIKQLQTELNEASRCIWAEKHDTDGNQMAVYRLGKNVFATGDLTSTLADENLDKAEARKLLAGFRRGLELKRTLATGDLTADERAKLQAEYDAFLNQYFELR